MMGGSLGLAARSGPVAERVHAYARREATREACLRLGAADAVFDTAGAAAAAAELAVVCVPILATRDLACEAAAAMPPGSVITDVGSTKGRVCAEIDAELRKSDVWFVGSHPIAGSDLTGIESSRADLYRGAMVVVTPSAGTPVEACDKVCAFWGGLGARVAVMSPEEHDARLARTSHLPHLVATEMVQLVLGDARGLGEYCGTGFGDATRIAAGSEAVWHDIVMTNQKAVVDELRTFADALTQQADMIAAGRSDGITERLARARRLRQAWGSGEKTCDG